MATGRTELALRIRADISQAQAELVRISGSIDRLAHSSSAMARETRAAGDALRGMSGGGSLRELTEIGSQIQRNQTLTMGLGAAWGALSHASSLIRMVDEYGQMAVRIRMATASAEEYEHVQARLLETASLTYRPLAEAQEAYLRTADSLKDMGYSADQAIDVSSSLSYLFVTNAASGDRAANAITAFSQSLQRGAIDVRAWRSLLVAVPDLAQKIAAATGETAEAIKKMGAEGKLAITSLTEGLRQSFEANKAATESMPVTVADAFTRLRTNLQAYLGEANRVEGVTATMAAAIGVLAKNVDLLVAGGFVLAVAAINRYIAALGIKTAANIRDINSTRAAALAAVADARAEVTRAQAKLAYAQSLIVAAARQRAAASLTAKLTAANNALAAAQARAAATSGVLATGARGLLGLLGGPVGLGLTVLTVAGSWLTFRDNTKTAETALIDLNGTTEEVIKKFNELSTAQQNAQIVNIQENLAKTREKYVEKAYDIAKTAKNEINAIFSSVGPETAAALEKALAAAKNVIRGQVADWNAVSDAVANAGDMNEALRRKLILLIAEANDIRSAGRGMSDVLREIGTSARGAADDIQRLNDVAAAKAVEEQWTKVRAIGEQIAALKFPSPLEKFERTELPALLTSGISPNDPVIAATRAYLKELERVQEAKRQANKPDPYAQKSADLARARAEAEQLLADAMAGVDAATHKNVRSLEAWLQTDRNARRFSEARKDALRAEAAATDAATQSLKAYNDAQKRAKAIAESMENIDIELLKLSGNTEEAALREFRTKYKDLIKNLQTEIAGGNETAKIQLNTVLEFQGLEAAKTQLDNILARIEKIRDAQSRDEETLQTQIAAGALTEVQARDRLLDIHHATAAELERIRPLLAELSNAPGEIGEKARAALQQLDDQARTLRATVGALQGALKDGLTTGITEALTGLAQGAMDLRDAITALGQAVLDAMMKIAVEHIAESATNSIMSMIGNLASAAAGSGGGDAAGAAADTTAASALGTAATGMSTALGTAATSMSTALGTAATSMSTALGTAATGMSTALGTAASGMSMALGSAAGLLNTAAGALITAAAGEGASSAIGAVGAVAGAAAAASGGIIPGHSPHDRADNIPAWLTAGEFVTRRPVMRQPGALAFMTAFNRLGMPAIAAWARRLRLPGYAAGGPVLPAPAPAIDTAAIVRDWQPVDPPAAGNTTVQNKQIFNLIDDPSRYYDALKTPQGMEAITVMLSRDPAKFRAVLGL
jgi:tape measure domain-containing protein